MSVGALGSFAQGLVQGYRIGDEMQTADKRRKYIDQQTALDAQKTDLVGMQIAKQRKIDAAGDELAAAVKDVMPGPDGTMPGTSAIADPSKENEKFNRWQNAYTNYLSIAKPEALNDLRKSNKQEALGDWARGVSRTVSGLMNGDPNAFAPAAKLYGLVPDGFDIDPTQSTYDKDKNPVFAVRNQKTGDVQMITKPRDEVHRLGFYGLTNPADVLTSYERELTRQDNKEYRQELVEQRREAALLRAQSARDAQAQRAEYARQFNATREDRLKQDYMVRTLGQLKTSFDLEADDIKNGATGSFRTEEEKSAAIRTLGQARAIAENGLVFNAEAGLRVSPADMASQAKQYMAATQFRREMENAKDPATQKQVLSKYGGQAPTFQLAPVPDGKGGYRNDVGQLPSGAYFPILPGMNLSK